MSVGITDERFSRYLVPNSTPSGLSKRFHSKVYLRATYTLELTSPYIAIETFCVVLV